MSTKEPSIPTNVPILVEGEKGEPVTLLVNGRISLDNLKELMPLIQPILEENLPSKLTVDLKGVDYLDSAGTLFLMTLEIEARNRSIPLNFINLNDDQKRILTLFPRDLLSTESQASKIKIPGIIEQLGETFLGQLTNMVKIVSFTGELLRAMGFSFLHPKTIRWRDVLLYIEKVGVDGLPIIALIHLLLGLIMAFMTSLQLQQFGANIYIAPLVAIAMVKELGPIMTAILVAGRSGSAFASAIGTMMVNEEVDALSVMGFDPTRFLAVPRTMAAMVAVPLLTLFADFFAILGGLLVGVMGLDLGMFTYLKETMKALSVFDILSGVIKSLVFAILIAGIGCQRGFQVRGGAEAVGAATTSSVVSAILLIIVADSIFAIIFHYVRY